MSWKRGVMIVFGLLAVLAGLYASGWMIIKLGLGVVLVALYVSVWVMVVRLGQELIPRRKQALMLHKLGDIDGHADRETNTRRRFTAEDDVEGEGARPSSLLPYYHHKPDRAYLLQLEREVEIANEETVRKYGPLPPGGLPEQQKKTKPKRPYRDVQGSLARELPIIEENDKMNLKEMAAAAALAAGMTTCQSNAGGSQPSDPQKTHNKVMYASGSTRIALSKQCGDLEVQLICPVQAGALDCKQTALSMTRDGVSSKIDKPREMVHYAAVGISCAPSTKDGKWYFVVQYGELPEGCSYCEWLYLYDDNGKQLTRSNPPLLFDENLPGYDKHFPNNREFEQLRRNLGFGRFQIEFVNCDASTDNKGNVTCLMGDSHAKG